jgi:sortase A
MNIPKTYKILRILNLTFGILIAIVAIFMILRPYIPEILFAITSKEFSGYAYQSDKSLATIGDKAKKLPKIPAENRLVIPSIFINSPITEGEETKALMLGMWRVTNTSTPDKGGNTVIAGHRALHTTGPDTLYMLNKVAVGDILLAYWQGKEYVYKVYEISEVTPDQTEILNSTDKSILTLYTCTPLWTFEKRLVVKALLQ